jgi:hypothetical protein
MENTSSCDDKTQKQIELNKEQKEQARAQDQGQKQEQEQEHSHHEDNDSNDSDNSYNSDSDSSEEISMFEIACLLLIIHNFKEEENHNCIIELCSELSILSDDDKELITISPHQIYSYIRKFKKYIENSLELSISINKYNNFMKFDNDKLGHYFDDSLRTIMSKKCFGSNTFGELYTISQRDRDDDDSYNDDIDQTWYKIYNGVVITIPEIQRLSDGNKLVYNNIILYNANDTTPSVLGALNIVTTSNKKPLTKEDFLVANRKDYAYEEYDGDDSPELMASAKNELVGSVENMISNYMPCINETGYYEKYMRWIRLKVLDFAIYNLSDYY